MRDKLPARRSLPVTPAVAPEREAFAGGGRPAQSASARASCSSCCGCEDRAPRRPRPRFDRQQALIRQNGGQPPAISQSRRAEPQQQARPVQVRMAPPARQVTTPQRDACNRPRAAAERESAGTAAQQRAAKYMLSKTIDRLTKRGRIIRSNQTMRSRIALVDRPQQHAAAK